MYPFELHSILPALLLVACSSELPSAVGDSAALAGVDSAAPDTAGAPIGAGGDSGGGLTEEEGPRRVLMISVDTLRRDRVGRYSGLDTSPTLDALLADGLTLEDHRSCSNWTYSSVLCLYTGRSELDLGWFANGSSRAVPEPAPEGMPTLAGWLREAGYTSALVSANSFISANYNMTEGFDEVVSEFDLSATEVTEAAIDMLDGVLAAPLAAGEPVFLHAHFIDPHLPYNPPAPYQADIEVPSLPLDMRTIDGVTELAGLAAQLPEEELDQYIAWIEALYRGEIRYADTEIARLLEAVDARSDLSEWIVVLWSDHGEQFFEHGGGTPHPELYGGETLGITSFSGPGIGDELVSAPSTHADIAPTLLDLLGLPIPDGVTGLPARQIPADRPRYSMFVEERQTQQAVDYRGERLLYQWNGALEYYRLEGDPGEREDLFEPGDPEVRALWDLLEPQVRALEAIYTATTPAEPAL